MLEFLRISYYGISIFIIIVMIFICIYLVLKVKLLKEQLKDLNESKSNVKILKPDDDVIPIKDISESIKVKEIPKYFEEDKTIEIKIKKDTSKQTEVSKSNNKNIKHKIELYQPNYKNKTNNKKEAYSKNVLNNRPNITSPVSINNNEEFNISDFVPEKRNNKVKNNSTDYLNEVSKEIEKELKSQTIELTDYEQEQEDNAIISYKELLNVKDKIKNIPDEEETVDFIEELKKLRNSLE